LVSANEITSISGSLVNRAFDMSEQQKQLTSFFKEQCCVKQMLTVFARATG